MICIAGKNEIAIYGLELLLEKGIPKSQIVALINKTDIGINSWQPSFKRKCEIQQINIVTQEELFNLDELVLISLEYDQILKTQRFKSKKLYNIHFSYLPKYKGMYTSILPILDGEKSSGVTLHKIDQGIDTGEIIDQIQFEIPFESTGFDLYSSYLKHSKLLLKKNIDILLCSSPLSNSQTHFDSSYYSKKSINFESINIDFRKTCFQICNFFNAFAFRPYQLLKYKNHQICRAIHTTECSTEPPGKIVYEDSQTFKIATIDYNVILLKDSLNEILKASERNDVDFLIELNKRGFNLNEKNAMGWNSLIVSSYNNSFECVKYIIDNNLSDINTVNNNGTTVAMYAMTSSSKTNDFRILELLIENGVRLWQLDFAGKDIFYYANQYSNPLVIDYLSKYK